MLCDKTGLMKRTELIQVYWMDKVTNTILRIQTLGYLLTRCESLLNKPKLSVSEALETVFGSFGFTVHIFSVDKNVNFLYQLICQSTRVL